MYNWLTSRGKIVNALRKRKTPEMLIYSSMHQLLSHDSICHSYRKLGISIPHQVAGGFKSKKRSTRGGGETSGAQASKWS